MRSRHKLSVAAVLLAGLCFYATPYLALHQIRSAAAAQDAAKLAGYVDFPALRQSLKTGVQARLIGTERDEQGQPSRAHVMGAAVAGALLGPMVDSLITPESLARLLQGQQPMAAATGIGGEPAQPGKLQTHMAYEGPDRFVFSVRKSGEDEEPVDLVLRRDGLLHWKLAELRLP